MKAVQENKYNILDALIANKTNFAIYRLPREQDINFVQQTCMQHDIYDDLPSVNVEKGFVIAPFCSSQTDKVIVIRPDVFMSGEEEIFNYLKNLHLNKRYKDEHTALAVSVTASSTFDHYQKAYQAFHSRLADQTFEKLVLSRTLEVSKPSTFSAGEIFAKACQKYPDNFIYLLHHEACGVWLGCSPEIIVAGENGQWKTDALAGTQALPSTQQHIEWDDKNQLEQKIVKDYMQQQLSALNIPSTAHPPRTIRSGNVVHLHSEIGFQLTDVTQIFNLLNVLHPSPAVCGVPKKQAFQFIIENEGYNRAYYSGFVGSLDFKGKTDLFVNLRCMQIFDNHLRLYAGGGILPSSSLDTEWKETQHKLQTVLSLLE